MEFIVVEAGPGPPVLLSRPCPEIHSKCLQLKTTEDSRPKEVVSVGEGTRRAGPLSSGWCVGPDLGCHSGDGSWLCVGVGRSGVGVVGNDT